MDLELILLIIAGLLLVYVAFVVGKKLGSLAAHKYWEDQLPKEREDAVKRSRAVLSGQFSEQLAPYLPDFKYKPSEARFIGKPIDFIVFDGLDGKNVTDVIFVEVKSGNSQLSTQERRVRDAIRHGRVRWELYQVPEEVTKERNRG